MPELISISRIKYSIPPKNSFIELISRFQKKKRENSLAGKGTEELKPTH